MCKVLSSVGLNMSFVLLMTYSVVGRRPRLHKVIMLVS